MSTPITNLHDAFFKQVLGDPELAGKFLREHLPADVVEQLGPEMPEPLPASFVDEELRQHHSDLLFRVSLKAGGDAFAYLLLEHKSSSDDGTRLQLLRYIVRLLTKWYEQNGRTLPLPPVLPLVAHQGPGEWSVSCEFADLFGDVSPALRPYLPGFRHALVDLPTIRDENLSATASLRALLKALKYARRPELPERLDITARSRAAPISRSPGHTTLWPPSAHQHNTCTSAINAPRTGIASLLRCAISRVPGFGKKFPKRSD